MANTENWCFAPIAPDPHADTGKEKAALLKEAMWDAGRVIIVSFLEMQPELEELRAKVAAVAGEWTGLGMANLAFQFVTSPMAGEVRISFQRKGSWSYVGNSCLRIQNRYEPTMNFGTLTLLSREEEIRRVVLHEFGHALGMIHEHASPAAGMQWNRPQVIADLCVYWSRAQIEINVFRAYDARETNFTAFDPTSIMVYPIPARWTLNGFSTDFNTDLSPLDRAFIHTQYP